MVNLNNTDKCNTGPLISPNEDELYGVMIYDDNRHDCPWNIDEEYTVPDVTPVEPGEPSKLSEEPEYDFNIYISSAGNKEHTGGGIVAYEGKGLHGMFAGNYKENSTPNLAHLEVAIAVLKFALRRPDKSVLILTSSEYVVKAPEWFKAWSSKDKRKKSNVDTISTLVDLLEEVGSRVRFKHVRRDSESPGNIVASKLSLIGIERKLKEIKRVHDKPKLEREALMQLQD